MTTSTRPEKELDSARNAVSSSAEFVTSKVINMTGTIRNMKEQWGRKQYEGMFIMLMWPAAMVISTVLVQLDRKFNPTWYELQLQEEQKKTEALCENKILKGGVCNHWYEIWKTKENK